MPLRFRNIDATPADPVSMWGFEGMLAAIDRGYLQDWDKLARAVAAEPELRDDFNDALAAAESRAAAKAVELLGAKHAMTDGARALARLRRAAWKTGLTQEQLAVELGTSRTRLSSYLNGRVTPSMDVLVAVERIADERIGWALPVVAA